MTRAQGDRIETTILGPNDERVRVACPRCEKQRTVTPGIYLCGDCGTWFGVRSSRGDQA